MTAWSGNMAEVAEVCGDDVARELCEKLPGTSFYIPKKFRHRGSLRSLDKDTARVLVRHFGGDYIYIPSQRKNSHDTFKAIETLVDQGLTTSQIATKLGISQSYIFRLRRKAGAPKIAKKRKRQKRPLNSTG